MDDFEPHRAIARAEALGEATLGHTQSDMGKTHISRMACETLLNRRMSRFLVLPVLHPCQTCKRATGRLAGIADRKNQFDRCNQKCNVRA